MELSKQKRGRIVRKENRTKEIKQVQTIYGYDFETVREVFKFCFNISDVSTKEYLRQKEFISDTEFRKAVNRYSRRQERETYQMVAWVGVENLGTPCDE